MKFVILLFFGVLQMSYSQEFMPTHIGIGSQSYYEIVKIDDQHYEVLALSAENSEIKEESFKVENLKNFKRERRLHILEKTKQLKKSWFLNRDVQFSIKGDKGYRVWIKRDGSMRFFFLKESKESPYDSWCSPKEQPIFITRKHTNFEILLIIKDNTLNVMYSTRRKGVSGYIEEVSVME